MASQKDKLTEWLRWLAVLPGALLASFLVTFPLHWLLYLKFANGGTLFGIVALPPGASETIERAIYPFVIAITFIITGYKIAPNHKFRASVALGVLYAVTFGAVAIIQPYQRQLEARSLVAFVGMLLGVYWTWRQSKLEQSWNTKPSSAKVPLKQFAKQVGEQFVAGLNSLDDGNKQQSQPISTGRDYSQALEKEFEKSGLSHLLQKMEQLPTKKSGKFTAVFRPWEHKRKNKEQP